MILDVMLDTSMTYGLLLNVNQNVLVIGSMMKKMMNALVYTLVIYMSFMILSLKLV
jgi:hypothetical protein